MNDILSSVGAHKIPPSLTAGLLESVGRVKGVRTVETIRVGIVGISGYSGGMALELLLNHPQVRVTYVSANNTQGPLEKIWPRLKTKTHLTCDQFNVTRALELCDLFFLAVPHGVSQEIVPRLLKTGKRVIDLSADYRLKNPRDYERWYDRKHTDKNNLIKAVYGLPELYRQAIKKASLVANPGCYPTAAILALAPVISAYEKHISSIIIDAKSGVSGAGRKTVPHLMFSEVHENFKAYKVLSHQHTPEINLYLSKLAGRGLEVVFVPHLLPIHRGILETIYVQWKEKIHENKILDLFKKFYKTEPFVRVGSWGSQPELKDVAGTNYCDIGLALSKDRNLLVISCVIDNLIKGASGQAVQNMNIMYGFEETEAL